MTAGFRIALAVALLPAAASAQTVQAPVMGRFSATQVGIEPMMRLDARSCAALARAGAAFELASARLALSRSRSPAVRRFATAALRDHARLAADLGRTPARPRRFPGALDCPAMLAALTADAATFDRCYLDQQLAAHRHAWALDSGYAADGRDSRLRALAMRALAVDEAHLGMLPMRPMRY